MWLQLSEATGVSMSQGVGGTLVVHANTLDSPITDCQLYEGILQVY